jgi:hypothetical protein
VEESQLEDFTMKGLLPSKAVAHWRAPLAKHEEPHPEDDEIVSFLAFHERGLGYPAHPFLLSLLNEWGWSYNTSTQMGCYSCPDLRRGGGSSSCLAAPHLLRARHARPPPSLRSFSFRFAAP